MKDFFQEFKTFALRGNVIDLAVGIIIGAAFGKITTSLVNDVVMPALGFFTGGVNLAKLEWVIKENAEAADLIVRYGQFLQATLDFLIVAFALFIVIKFINRLHKKEEKKTEVKKSKEVALLEEIRDTLQAQK